MTPEPGVIVAALTPRGKRGELNFGASFELIDFLCKAQVRAIALLTAAGEYPAFSMDERIRLIHLGAKRTRVPLLAGVGSEELDRSVELAREALAAGATGVLLPPPTLFAYPQPELHEYYLQFAAQTGPAASVWIVSAPPLAAVTAEALMRSGKFAGLVGRDLDISSEACAAPELFVALDCARRTGNSARTAELEARAREFQQWADRLPPLLAIKAALGLRGIPMGPLPVPVSPERQRVVEEFREWFRAWLPKMKKMAAHA